MYKMGSPIIKTNVTWKYDQIQITPLAVKPKWQVLVLVHRLKKKFTYTFLFTNTAREIGTIKFCHLKI